MPSKLTRATNASSNFTIGSFAQPSILTKYKNWVYILRKIHLTEACPVTQSLVSLQSNSYWYISLSATLTTHGSCKESNWAIKCWASMHKLLCWIEDFGKVSLKKSMHRTSTSKRLSRPSIPSLNEWKEVSTTRSCHHLLQARNSMKIGSDGAWRS